MKVYVYFFRYRSDIIMKVANILTSRNDMPRSVFTYRDDKHRYIINMIFWGNVCNSIFFKGSFPQI